jgi:branched-chain amino acid transport system ATP-binding protein
MMNMNAPAALAVEGLVAGYGRIEALRGISISLQPGQLVALVGANGAGKTTLLRTLSGLISARAGCVRLFGEDITAASPERRVRAGLAQVLEGRQVFGPLSVQDNLRLGAYTKPEQAAQRMEAMYELFPVLKDKRLLPAGTLSGGQQQMLAMARALMSQPRVLLLDEPSMGLAPLLVREVFGVVQRLKEQGVPILLVEQNARAALSIADHGHVLEAGRVVLSGPAQQLLHDERVQEAYLGL